MLNRLSYQVLFGPSQNVFIRFDWTSDNDDNTTKIRAKHALFDWKKKKNRILYDIRWMCKCWMTVCSAFHCSCGDISMLQIELCVFLWCSWTNQQFNRNNNKRTSKQTNYGYNLRNIVLTDKFSVNAINLTSMQKYSRFLAWYSRYFCFFSSLFGMNITTWHIPCGKKISFDISIN